MKIKFYASLLLIMLGSLGLKAQTGIDLYVRDSVGDIGLEPNTTNWMWMSPDIWVRNAKDGGLVHQNPEYNTSGTPNVVYVRVTNRGTQASTGYEMLRTYWAKAGTSLSWTSPWLGGVYHNGALMGSPIGMANIPILQPGQQTILAFPWVVPNPYEYTIDRWHFCLLARIVASTDPMTFTETTNLGANVKNNNNIAWKNVSVIDIIPNIVKKPGAAIAIGKQHGRIKPFYLEFIAQKVEKGKAIYEEAEVAIELDNKLAMVWEQGGKKARFIEERIEENKLIVRGNNAILDNLYFENEEVGLLDLTFNFLTEEPSEKTEYIYYVIQKEMETGEIIGGETYIINRYPKDEAPKEVVESNNVTIKLGRLENISPNPTSDKITVKYKLNGVDSAHLMIIGIYETGTSNNYILDASSSQTTLDISKYPAGLYKVVLVCNGKNVDTKSLLKQ